MAKATAWANTDTEARKRGEQTGLDTLVVHALNDANWMLGAMSRTFQRWIGAFGNANTGAAWLSSARVVRCWVKSRNERNPCP